MAHSIFYRIKHKKLLGGAILSKTETINPHINSTLEDPIEQLNHRLTRLENRLDEGLKDLDNITRAILRRVVIFKTSEKV